MAKVQSKPQNPDAITASILSHYRKSARDLPWRVPPDMSYKHRPDPYHIWLSEIMLQQTTVAAVINYFISFRSRWPNFAALAAADDADVMAAWAGLGYYARARNLLACARKVVRDYDGALPQTEAMLLSLPGIGPYTAAAIAAIAFGQRAIVMDANIERVVSRLYAIDTPLPQSKPLIRAQLELITPIENSGDFAQALMDLGAGICSMRNPACGQCPIAQFCAASQSDYPAAYPIKRAKAPKPKRIGTAYWIERDGAVWLVKRPENGMLGGMRALPDDNWTARHDGHAAPPFDADWHFLTNIVQHEFTHFSLQMRIAVTDMANDEMQEAGGEYWPVKLLDKAGLPTLFSKIAKLKSQCNRVDGEH